MLETQVQDKPRVGVRFMVALAAIGATPQIAYFGILAILLPRMIERIYPDQKIVELGMLTSAWALMLMLAAPILGALSDRTSSRHGRRRPWVVLATICIAAGILLLSGVNSAAVAIIAGLILNIGIAAASAVGTAAVIADRVPEGQLGLASAASGFGPIVGSVLGTSLAAELDPRWVYWVMAIIAVIGPVMHILLINEAPFKAPRSPLAFSALGAVKSFWVSPAKHPGFAWMFVGGFMILFALLISNTFLLYYLDDVVKWSAIVPGATAEDGARELSIALFVGLVSMTVGGGPVSDWVGRRKPFVLAAVVALTIGIVLLATQMNREGLWVSQFLLGAGTGLFFSVSQAIAIAVLPNQTDQGKDLGILGVSFTLPQVVAPLIGSAVINGSTGYNELFVVAVVSGVLGYLAILRIREVR